MILAVDFDGTLVCNEYPDLGFPNMELIHALIELQGQGHTLILWTCRTSHSLYEAVAMMTNLGLCFDYINRNTDEVIKEFGGDTRKIYADIYIDDKACRMFVPHDKSYSQYVLEALIEERYNNAAGVKSAEISS